MKTKLVRFAVSRRKTEGPDPFFPRPFHNVTCQSGVTLIEILVGVAVIAIMVSLLVPSVSRMLESGRTAHCVGNQKQLAVAIALYASDNDGRIPFFGEQNAQTGGWSGGFWEQSLAPYIDIKVDNTKYQALGDTYFRCPSAPAGSGSTYGVNYPDVFAIGNSPYFGSPKKMGNLPANTMMTADVDGLNAIYSPLVFPFNSSSGETGRLDSFGSAKFNYAKPRHNGSIVCSFADGRVEKVVILDFIENRNGLWGPK